MNVNEGSVLLAEAPLDFLEELRNLTECASSWPAMGFTCVSGRMAPECRPNPGEVLYIRVGNKWLTKYIDDNEKWAYLKKWSTIRKLRDTTRECSCTKCMTEEYTKGGS
jgi:hypothetical protein